MPLSIKPRTPLQVPGVVFLVWLALQLGGAAGLEWEQHPGYRMARLHVPASGHTGFTLLSPEQTGVLFTNQPSAERMTLYHSAMEGAGVCAGDFDGDGLPDLYFCNIEGPNALFRNVGGFKFERVTDAAGAACTNQISRGAVFADINGDGWPDLIVSSLNGPNACLLNDGKGHFQDITREAGLVLTGSGCTSLALADIDGDGSLDLYIAISGLTSSDDQSVFYTTRNGQLQLVGRARQRFKLVNGRLLAKGFAHALYLNDGTGHFRAVSWTDGTFLDMQGKPLKEAPADIGLSVMFRDLNGDGAPDIYVCNDWESPDRIWINDGHGHFRALPDLAVRKTSLFSMSVDFADINRDGYDDMFNADMISRYSGARLRQLGGTNPPAAFVGESMDRQQARRNTLQLNRGDGTFAEIANFAGVAASDWTWCVAFLDVDLDGYEDLLTLNGHVFDLQDRDAREQDHANSGSAQMRGGAGSKVYPPLQVPNYLFRNRRDGTFEEVGSAWGFNSTNACHGVSLVDLDNDGDLDVVVSCLGKPPLIYRNDSTAPRVAVRLKGNPPNTAGIGSKLILRNGAVPQQSQEIQCGGRYLSSDQPMRTFAAGSLTNRMSLEVQWRSGRRSLLTNIEPNCLIEVEEAAAVGPAGSIQTSAPASQPLFEDLSASLGHKHSEAPFDDFNRQPLLPRQLSRLGPGVAWYDLDGDGRDDLIIGGGRGSGIGIYLNAGSNGWRRAEGPWLAALPDDSSGLVAGVLKPGTRPLLAGLARYETVQTNLPSVVRFDWSEQSAPAAKGEATAALDGSSGPLALGAVNGDDSLDLFVGGRLQAGRYPEAVDSLLLRNSNGQLQPDAQNADVFKALGLVTGAVFSDLDNDGFPELLLTCEWGAPLIFKNSKGRFARWDAPLIHPPAARASRCAEVLGAASHLSDLTGLWTCIATGDFDGDGRLDIVLGNWGLNSAYELGNPGPWMLLYGDLNEDGGVHVIEAYRDSQTGKQKPWRDMSVLQTDLPWVRARAGSHRAYSEADLGDILGERKLKAKQRTAVLLGSLLLLNRGDKFEPVLLPDAAQLSPAMGLAVGDFNGDGKEDLFIAQNYFAVRPEDDRLDSGRGLLLLGDGHGGFAALAGQESGIKIYGEQRGCAVADYDADGRLDLVVTQNNAETCLFHNRMGKPGLRVRLEGPPANPDGVGAVMREKYADGFGPAREVQAGSGYWSQNSPVQVLGMANEMQGVEVRWPGGKTILYPVSGPARSVTLSWDGRIRVQQ